MIATGNHLRFTIRCALQHAPTRGERTWNTRGGAVAGFFCYVTPWKRITERSTDAQRRELFQGRALWGRGNASRSGPMVDRPHLKRLPGSVLWLPFLPNKKVPPPAGCHVRNRKCLTTPPAFCPDKKPPPLTRGGMGALRTRGNGERLLANCLYFPQDENPCCISSVF